MGQQSALGKVDVDKFNENTKEQFEDGDYSDIFLSKAKQIEETERIGKIKEIIEGCEDNVVERAEDKGKDVSQVKNVVVGNGFQGLIAYFTADIAAENGFRVMLNPNVGAHEILNPLEIEIPGGDTLKPDTDLVYYKPNEPESPIYIISCKTSFRERFKQSGLWKLIYEIGVYDCENDECPTHSYKLSSEMDREVKMGFATLDFHNELENDNLTEMFEFGYTPDGSDKENVRAIEQIIYDIKNRW